MKTEQKKPSTRCLFSHESRYIPADGFTLIEVLVAIAIIGAMVGLLLPALQSARASARKVDCGNRLKQIALAAHGFETRSGHFPSFSVPDEVNPLRRQHNLFAFLLRDLEQSALADQYSFDHEWFEALRPTPETANLRLSKISIPSVLCPSSPQESLTGTADYAICVGLSSDSDGARQRLLNEGTITPRTDWRGMLAPIDPHSRRFLKIRRQDIGDGLSGTIMLCEDSARPDYYIAGTRRYDSGIAPVSGALWADPEGEFSVNVLCNGSLINCNNDNEIYSFHAEGANFAFGDGSVRFLAESVSAEALVSLTTRNAED